MISRDIDLAVESLNRGALIVMPTDTVYGLVAHPDRSDAVERLYKVKGRDRNKPIPLLVAGTEDVEKRAGGLSAIELNLAKAFWPGPLTIIVGGEGYRVPASDMAVSVIKASGGALRATSANLSGEEPALTAEDAESFLGTMVDVVLDDGVISGGVASTVAKVETGKIVVLRAGVVSLDMLNEATDLR